MPSSLIPWFTRSDGVRPVLRLGFLAGVLSLIGACVTTPSTEDTATVCADPRPQVCTMLYAPVCATHRDSHLETHSSSCNACADDTVVSYRSGVCEETQSK